MCMGYFCIQISNRSEGYILFKKILTILIYVLLLFSFMSCNKKETESISSYFAWMNSYIATPKDEEDSVVLMLFVEVDKMPFDIDDASSLTFDGIEDAIQITDVGVDRSETDLFSKRSSYSVYLDYKAVKKGIFKTESLTIQNRNGEKESYPIGSWAFDVDEKESKTRFVDTSRSPARSDNNTQFSYRYKIEDPAVKITKIWFGPESYISDLNGLEKDGFFDIWEDNCAPITYIKTKFQVNASGNDVMMYGEGCYCGEAANYKTIRAISKEYNEKVRRSD